MNSHNVVGNRKKCRSPRKVAHTNIGVSLTELLMASLLIVIVSAIIGELMVAITYTATRLNNREECMITARTAVNRIVSNVRTAHNIAFTAPSISGPTPMGWPAQPWNCDDQTLVLKMPVSTDDITGGAFKMKTVETNSYPVYVPNLETLVFKVIADPYNHGQFLLQTLKIPHSGLISSEAQTIATGLVDSNSNSAAAPKVFSFYIKGNSNGLQKITADQLSQSNINQADDLVIRGVTVDLNVKKSAGNELHKQVMSIRTEAFQAYKPYF